ncbi:DNA polymerase III subunit epsilon [Lichenihabitans sp. Uapishka_5]|uniref:DNA polymerase III subunit epsilon n=1 Tax=Lichenihabitans sp. Uapishka_5 TaxID=3037302 RepID=UPI0029E7EA6D|nr:DNA polymerase III subunit epsilon [Lichenihabitans sp. Uapishka_5]MDX7953533.1 DNA polymerase III subunit epsilon [Lichenihabitans sp. Uapishka_5]
MREIVLDTETTGLDPKTGDRLVEIAGVELINSIPTGRHYHTYVNPERDMPDGAFRVHGLSAEFLSAHRVFSLVADEFLDYVGDARLVIHNAEFDMRFINHELARLTCGAIGMERVTDTLAMARRKHPGAPASLDALCLRYKIDNTKRTVHGALIDAQILADVYLELLGGRQQTLGLAANVITLRRDSREVVRQRPTPLGSALTPAEAEAHVAFVATLGSTPAWAAYEAKAAG